MNRKRNGSALFLVVVVLLATGSFFARNQIVMATGYTIEKIKSAIDKNKDGTYVFEKEDTRIIEIHSKKTVSNDVDVDTIKDEIYVDFKSSGKQILEEVSGIKKTLLKYINTDNINNKQTDVSVNNESFIDTPFKITSSELIKENKDIITIPVDIEKIASKYSITMTPKNFSETEDNNTICVISMKDKQISAEFLSTLTDTQKRYTEAHMLGHLFNGHLRLNENSEIVDTKLIFDTKLLTHSNKKERDATLFALDLLMPTNALLDAIGTKGTNIKDISLKFDVDPKLVDFYIRNLLRQKGYDPVKILGKENI